MYAIRSYYVLVNISGSSNMTMEEFDEASRIIHDKVHEDANIIIGLVVNEKLGDRIQITAIATGFGESFDTSSDEARIRGSITAASGRENLV